MAARKGIRDRLIVMFESDPTRWWTGRELESEYIKLGGNRAKDRPGMNPTTIWRLIRELPVTVVRPGRKDRLGYNLDARLRLDPERLQQQRERGYVAERARIRGIWDGLLPSTP